MGEKIIVRLPSLISVADVAPMIHSIPLIPRVLYLGGEVSVKYALAVQVLQPPGDIQRQADPDTPRQVQVTVQQLL